MTHDPIAFARAVNAAHLDRINRRPRYAAANDNQPPARPAGEPHQPRLF